MHRTVQMLFIQPRKSSWFTSYGSTAEMVGGRQAGFLRMTLAETTGGCEQPYVRDSRFLVLAARLQFPHGAITPLMRYRTETWRLAFCHTTQGLAAQQSVPVFLNML